MKAKPRTIFYLSILVGVAVYLCIFLDSGVLFPFLLGGTVLAGAVFVATARSSGKWPARANTAVAVLVLTYLVLEVASYALLSFGFLRTDMGFFFGGFTGNDRPVAVYDSACGYRAVPGERRNLSISGGDLEYDHITKANAQGWYSTRDYTYAKGNKKRYMVLGDSYSSGLSVPVTWIDQVQTRLREQGNDSVELYNFSLDGAGLVNWYRIYRYEIVPRYAFDGIIIAASSERNGVPDLDRNLIIAHSYPNMSYMAVVDPAHEPVPAVFDKRRAVPITPICSNAQMDEIKERYRSRSFSPRCRYYPPDLYFLNLLDRLGNGLYNLFYFLDHMKAYREPYGNYEALADQAYRAEFFGARYKNAHLLQEIMDDCRRNGKEVVWVTVPDIENALEYVRGHEIIYRKEAVFLANRYGMRLYDGYQMFSGKNESFVRNHYYKYDLHWNAKGAALFSEGVASGLFGP